MVMLFVRGGMQVLIGWIMVSTGINSDNVYVTHFSLATHFMAAMVLICYTLVFALSMRVPKENRIANAGLRNFAVGIAAVLCLQLIYGAFMAGLKAASVAPTWPGINGELVPVNLFANGFFEDILHNTITIHFIHRTLAFLVLVLVLAWWRKATKEKSSVSFTRAKQWPVILVIAQVFLGVLTVISSPGIIAGRFGIFEWLAELHQLTGMLLLLSIITVVYILKPSAGG